VLAWIVEQFRGWWPRCDRPLGGSVGDNNAWDASEFLHRLINRLAEDLSIEAANALEALVSQSEDEYTSFLRYAAERQRAARREARAPVITIGRLSNVVTAQSPQDSDDLLVMVCHAVSRFQAQLRGDDTDSVVKYWTDAGEPRSEDECTNRLIEDLERWLAPQGIRHTPQAQMPSGKRADVLFTIERAVLPVECKGQWHRELWSAAGSQLDTWYLRDWRCQETGLYVVYWFGEDVEPRARLQGPPGGGKRPTSPEELQELLKVHLPASRRGSIAVEVLDFSRLRVRKKGSEER
jgi:hypothetical protein